ncbi:MAG: DUF3179 domain-containing protein, partial [Candidatus Hydrogenedentota bacterium]
LLEENIVSGGPPKDGIPSVDGPSYTTAEEADSWLLPNDVVFGVEYEGFIAAYPQRILVWHEIVNETVNDDRVAIAYCPLTGSVIGYKGLIPPDVQSTFGVSGKLVNSNLIMYDRASDSYWPQILGRAIKGTSKGSSLKEFPIVWTSWEKWKRRHPNTKVLSQKTGFIRNYGTDGDPYGSYINDDQGYYTSRRVFFKPIYEDMRLAPKEVVVGMRDEKGNALAIVKDSLRERKTIEASLGERTVVATYDSDLDSYSAKIKDTGEWINAFDVMWFAWIGYYPDSSLVQ